MFITKVLLNKAKIEDIDNYIDEWHEGKAPKGCKELRQYLGMSKSEYAKWVENPNCLKSIIDYHKNISNIENELYERTSFPINVGLIVCEETLRAYNIIEKDPYGIEIWFNDMFGWACSDGMLFYCRVEGLENQLKKFNEWYDTEGSKFKEKFDAVIYPIYDKEKMTYTPSLEYYFEANQIIGKELAQSINNFCGIEFENWCW